MRAASRLVSDPSPNAFNWELFVENYRAWSVVDANGQTIAVSAAVSLQPYHVETHTPYTCTNYDGEDFFRTECFSEDSVTDGWRATANGIAYQ